MSTSRELRAFIEQHPKLFLLTGAGCSTDSGIPDYRDENGDWKHARPVQYADFIGDGSVRQRYWARSMLGWPRIAAARPNDAHSAIARLATQGRVRQLLTQNVDSLHQRAGNRDVIDLHGRLEQVICLACDWRERRERWQKQLMAMNTHWSVAKSDSRPAPDGDQHLENADYALFDVPNCPRCDGIVKPDVVFFGEPVPVNRVDRAYAALAESDALLVIGSSLMVFSGFRFARKAAETGKPIAILNLGKTRADDIAQLKITRPCGETLHAAVA